jgi:protein-tyrosine phosphatase
MLRSRDLRENGRTKILFVCLGNICRSPAAHAIFEALAKREGASDRIYVDSAGILDYHEGELPDRRMQKAAAKRGYQLDHRSRPVTTKDFHDFDLIIAMDREVQQSLQSIARERGLAHAISRIHLFLDFAGEEYQGKDVPDPYWSDDKGFEQVLDLVELGCKALLSKLKNGQEDNS